MKFRSLKFTPSLKSTLGALVILFSITSCVPLKKTVYLQDTEIAETTTEEEQPVSYRVQPNDNLFIRIFSSEETTNAFFNLSQANTYLNSEIAVDMGSYSVDENGEIGFPYVGQIKVAGKTIGEVRDLMLDIIHEYDEQTSVFVKLVNRQITVLGEVRQPGRYTISKDHVTIFEALAYAGDMTDYGKRKNVKIVRKINGQKEIYTVDLTDKNILLSDKYNLLPNDIVYVEPNNSVFGLKTLNLATILSALSVSLGVYTTFFN